MSLSDVDDGGIMSVCSLGIPNGDNNSKSVAIHTAINDVVETSRLNSYTDTLSLHPISVGLLSTAIFPKRLGQDYSKDTDVY